jgi:hypothetical protein
MGSRTISKSVAKVKNARKPKSLTKELMDKAIRHIATEIIAAKPDVNGRTPRGFAEKLLSEAKESLPKITMNKINYAITKLKKQLKNGALNITGSNISSLTDDNNPGTVHDSNSDDESLNTKLTSQYSSNNSDAFGSNDCSSSNSNSANLFLPDDVIASKKTTALQGGRTSNNSDVFGSNDHSSSNSNGARYLFLPDNVIASKKNNCFTR